MSCEKEKFAERHTLWQAKASRESWKLIIQSILSERRDLRAMVTAASQPQVTTTRLLHRLLP